MNSYSGALLIACVGFWPLSATAQQRLPIIDMHMHVSRVVLDADGKLIPVPCDPQPCQGASAAGPAGQAARLHRQPSHGRL